MDNSAPHLLIAQYRHDEPFEFTCSACAQPFLRPEDRDVEEGVIEIRQAFEEHLREQHPGALAS